MNAIRASVFVGTSVDGFMARADGALDFLPPVVASRMATTSSSHPSMRW